jgi:hypothetical protein
MMVMTSSYSVSKKTGEREEEEDAKRNNAPWMTGKFGGNGL